MNIDPTLSQVVEASAGTGKTYTIEHALLHLVEECGYALDEILVMTFTRAATRELKARIRLRFQKTPLRMQYAEVFTIHGFCAKLLLQHQPELQGVGEAELPSNRREVEQLLRGWLLSEEHTKMLWPAQLAHLTNFFRGSLAELVRATAAHLEGGETIIAPPTLEGELQNYHNLIECAHRSLMEQRGSAERLIEVYEEQKSFCKSFGKGENWSLQFANLAHVVEKNSPSRDHIESLIDQGLGSIKLLLERKKKSPSWTAPPPWPLFLKKLLPFVDRLREPSALFWRFCSIAQALQKRVEQPHVLKRPDQLLKYALSALQNEQVLNAVRAKYRVCIVDEFQDTDSLQWEILHALFCSSTDHRLLLVGDPKQSIYRFRGADLHTYTRAKESLNTHSRLETNWRSSPRMIEAINLLFSSREDLPYYPVYPSPNPPEELHDGLGSLHIHHVDEPTGGSRSAESALIKQIVKESEELLKEGLVKPEDIAILVRDRHQMKRVATAFCEKGLSISAQRAHNAFETDSFNLLLDAALATATKEKREITRLSLHPLIKGHPLPSLERLEKAFSRGGPAAFLQSLITQTEETEELVALEELFAQDPSYHESLEAWARFLLEEGPWQDLLVWPKSDESASRVMTIHASKGLEFSVVFALGLASRQREIPWLVKQPGGFAPRAHDSLAYERALDELEAEKIRLAYVALTRAKLRAVLPYIPPKGAPKHGLASPAELLFAPWKIEELLSAGGAALSSVRVSLSTLPAIGDPNDRPHVYAIK